MDALLKPIVVMLDRLRFRTKFLVIMVVFLAPMAVFGYLFTVELRQTIATAELERQGAEYIKPLRQLLEHVAQHRGMTNAFLNGDTSFGSKIDAKAALVNEDFSRLKEVDAKFGELLGTGEEAGQLQKSWQRLRSGARSMSAGDSFSAHSALIAKVIDLTGFVADRARLSTDPEPGTHELTAALVGLIPPVVENMGKARGQGAGVVAVGILSPDKKITLSVLEDRISVAAGEMESGFAHAFSVSSDLNPLIGSAVAEALEAIRGFKDATGREILNVSEISISADDYFALGTKAINANLALYDQIWPLLNERLLARADEARQKILGSTLLFVVVTLGLLYVFAGLYRSLHRKIEELLSVANHLAEGDLTGRVELKSKDEIAVLANAINHVAHDMGQSVLTITGSGDHLWHLGEQLLAASEQTQAGVAKQVVEINQAATAINEMTASAQEVAANTNRTAEEADLAKQAAESGRRVVSEAIASINNLAGEVEQAADVIRRLEENTEGISSILETIRGIADQTNLLALNAAIEAARAGEQGRGFAVVADEVRTLAQRTQDSTLEIQEMIERLQHGTSEAVGVMVSSGECAKGSVSHAAGAGEALEQITGTINTIHEMANQIATAVERQSVVAEEINRNISNVNELAEQTATDADESTEASNQVATLASEVRALLDRFKIDESALVQAVESRVNLMEWDDSFSVGITEVDRQHQKLVSMLNELNQILTKKRGICAVQRVLSGLVNYTATHFGYEERLMQKYSFPQYEEHKQKHEALVGKVLAFKERVDAGDGSVGDDLLEFVKEWLVGHIMGSDKEYGPFLNEKGIK